MFSKEIGRFEIIVPVHNFGKTPAKTMSSGLNVGLFKVGDDPDLDSLIAPYMGPRTALLLPGQSDYLKAKIRPAIPQDILDSLRKDQTIRVFGKAVYTDIFGKEHCTRWCYNTVSDPSGDIRFKACIVYTGIDPEEE